MDVARRRSPTAAAADAAGAHRRHRRRAHRPDARRPARPPGAGARARGVIDARAESAAAVGADLGVPVAGSVEEMLAAPDVDAVAICTSTDTHADLIVEAARAGKPIFCEKPVSLDLETVDRALEAVEAAGVPFQIGFNRRFDPAHASVRAAVAAGQVGDPHLVRITSRDPAPPPLSYVRVSGGIFLDMTIHDFDMARYVTGTEVVEVYARGAVRVDPAFAEAGDVDTAMVVLDARGRLPDVDRQLAPRRLRLRPARRGVRVRGPGGEREPARAHAASCARPRGRARPTLPYFYLERYTASYVREWEAFVAALAAGETPPVTTADARAPLVIGLAAWRSLREGRPVRIEEVAA